MKLILNIWRQKSTADAGRMVRYNLDNVSEHMSFLEMPDVLNEELITKGDDPVAVDHDCRAGNGGSGPWSSGRRASSTRTESLRRPPSPVSARERANS